MIIALKPSKELKKTELVFLRLKVCDKLGNSLGGNDFRPVSDLPQKDLYTALFGLQSDSKLCFVNFLNWLLHYTELSLNHCGILIEKVEKYWCAFVVVCLI